MSSSILVLTIGPVQGFIEEARRTRDLWFGSRILVDLIGTGIEKAKASGAVIVYPALGDIETSKPDLPNRFVAKTNSAKDENIAIACEEAINGAWLTLAEKAKSKLLAGQTPSAHFDTTWNRQITSFIEVYWAVADAASETETDLKAAYDLANRALGARKRTRAFSQAQEDGLKDSLSGSRSALCDVPTRDSAKEFWIAVSKNLTRAGNPTLVQSDGRECLDAIGVIKRFGKLDQNASFPSVSSIAAADFLRRAKKLGLHEPGRILNTYAEKVAGLEGKEVDKGFAKKFYPVGSGLKSPSVAEWNFDGDLFYASTLTAKKLEKDYNLKVDEDKLDELREILIEDLYRDAEIRPSTYFAILMMDADRMGVTMGERKALGELSEVSQKLMAFAAQARDIIESKFAGRVVYAGGDDVLALLPMTDALPAAIKLRAAFAESVGVTSISAGIALAHHQSPLSIALREARRAEHNAKDEYGRNAICIRALKRSGEHVQVGAKWDEDLSVITGLITAFEGLDPLEISSKFAFDLHEEAHAFDKWDNSANAPSAYESRVKYLLGRHIVKSKTDSQTEEQAKQDYPPKLRALRQTQKEKASGVADWALLARFIAQGGEE